MSIAKVVEIVGESKTSWEDAVRNAVREAARTVGTITGVEVVNWTGAVGPGGEITEYKADVQIACAVDGGR